MKCEVWNVEWSALKRGGPYEFCYLFVISRRFKIFCKGARKYYMTWNVGFSRCKYVLDIALADVIPFIDDTITHSDKLKILVFRLKDLTELILHGAATKNTKYIYTTWLKNQILENIPCLCETKKEKFTLVTLDSEIGRALFEACQSSSHDDRMIISKAASVIRKQLFNNDEIFDGDLSRERQMASIPQVLHQLIQLLLKGGTCNNTTFSICSSNMANNISKLIR